MSNSPTPNQPSMRSFQPYRLDFLSWIILILILTCLATVSDACTVFIVGKDATTDGSVLVSHSNDGEFETDPRLVKVPARDFSFSPLKGNNNNDNNNNNIIKRPVYFSPENYPRFVGTERDVPEYFPTEEYPMPFEPIGYIPQVAHTYAYLEETYGAVNEKQVGIGESTCSAVFGAVPLGAPNGTALWSIDELTRVAMERADSARAAIQLMGDLAVNHGGFYGAGEFEGTGESLAVTDTQEAWIFHILPDPTGTSAIWAAQKVPSDSFAVLANMFVIRQVDPLDKENFMMSESVHQVAQDYGWWKPTSPSSSSTMSSSDDTLLDFTKVYSDGEYAHKYYSGRRVWGAYHLAAASYQFPPDYDDLQSDPVYPVYVKPDAPLSVQDLFRFHRYTYQGTKYDLGAQGNLAAGPFGSPDRWKGGDGERIVSGNWERAIGLYRTSDTYVVQSSQQKKRLQEAVLWFGPASALGTVFTPFVVNGMSDIPPSFRSGHQRNFDRSSAFWAACVVHNIANLKWSYMIQDIQTLQNKLESDSVALLARLDDSDVDDKDHTNGGTSIEDALLENAANIVNAMWKLSDQLLFKYASGFVNDDRGMSQTKGYPAWWLQAVGYPDGPPPPPTEPKCCHPSKPISATTTLFNTNSTIASSTVGTLTGKAAMRQFLRTARVEML